MSVVPNPYRWIADPPRRLKDQAPDVGLPPGLRDRSKPKHEQLGDAVAPRPAAERRVPVAPPAVETPRPLTRPQTGKHVVILVENLPVPFDRRPWQIAQTLTREGYRVSVVCPKMYEYTRKYERLNGVDIYRYPSREGCGAIGWLCEYACALFWMTWVCIKLAVTQGIDAIHACNPPDLLFLVAWPFKVFFGVKFMFDHHDLSPEVYLAKFGRKDFLYRVMCAVEKMTFRLADVSLATNRSFKRIAGQRCEKDPDKVYIVRNAPMPGRFTRGRGRDELRFGRKHLVGYLGVMNKQDGLDLLLESIAHVVHHHGRRDVVFGLIGDGPEVPALKQRAAELKIDGEVKWLGRMSDGRQISDYLNTATVCVCPDPKNEMNDHSTMTKVVEYLALGKPVVAYDLAETLYTAADAAAYARNNDPRQFGDLIVRLLDDADQRKAMGLLGQSRYDAMLSWERSQEQLLNAYTRLFDPKSAIQPA